MMTLFITMYNFQKPGTWTIVELIIVRSMCWADLLSTYNYHGSGSIGWWSFCLINLHVTSVMGILACYKCNGHTVNGNTLWTLMHSIWVLFLQGLGDKAVGINPSTSLFFTPSYVISMYLHPSVSKNFQVKV